MYALPVEIRLSLRCPQGQNGRFRFGLKSVSASQDEGRRTLRVWEPSMLVSVGEGEAVHKGVEAHTLCLRIR